MFLNFCYFLNILLKKITTGKAYINFKHNYTHLYYNFKFSLNFSYPASIKWTGNGCPRQNSSRYVWTHQTFVLSWACVNFVWYRYALKYSVSCSNASHNSNFLGHANQCCAWLSIFPRCHDIFRRVGNFLPGQNTFYCITNFFFFMSPLGMSKLNHSRPFVFLIISFFSKTMQAWGPKVVVPFCLNI